MSTVSCPEIARWPHRGYPREAHAALRGAPVVGHRDGLIEGIVVAAGEWQRFNVHRRRGHRDPKRRWPSHRRRGRAPTRGSPGTTAATSPSRPWASQPSWRHSHR